MTEIILAIPTMNGDLLNDALDHAISNSFTMPSILVWANGKAITIAIEDSWVTVGGSEKNIGVTPALHKLYEMAIGTGANDSDFILFMHDDVQILEEHWDERVLGWLEDRPNCGIFGFGGARGLGDPDIYKTPYKLQQLARRDFISNMKNGEIHGRIVKYPTRVATLDLFTIGAKVSFLKSIKGWNWWPTVHHNLDHAICLEAIAQGLEVWMLPIHCHHKGGQTSTRVDFEQDFGMSEGNVHADAHTVLYDRYRHMLPIVVND